MSLDSTRDLSDSSDDDSCRGQRSKHRNYRSVEQVYIFFLFRTIVWSCGDYRFIVYIDFVNKTTVLGLKN